MKTKNTNLEIFNYLNLVNPRLGKLYKITGFNPLPDDFVFDENTIKERLYLGQMAKDISYPNFLFNEKIDLKKMFKLSVKRLNQISKSNFKKYLSKEFAEKFELYLVLRTKLTEILIREFKKEDFDEIGAYSEICSIDPIFFDLLDGIFESEFNFNEILNNLEDEYKIYYFEKLKKIEEKNNQKNNEKIQKIIINEKINKKIIENQKTELKNEIKSVKIQKQKEVEKVKNSIIEKTNKEK